MIDPLSTCNCLVSCLEEIKAWSNLNPMHHILFLDIELKLTGDFLRVSGSGPNHGRGARGRIFIRSSLVSNLMAVHSAKKNKHKG